MNRTKLGWVYLCIALGALLPTAWAQGEGTGATVAVSATGTAYGVPDRASFDAGVSVLDEDVAQATAEVSRRVGGLLASLTAAGVAEADVRTLQFNIFPEQLYDESGQPTRLRYRVVNTVRVTVLDTAQLGALLGESVAAGANEVANVVYTVADPGALERQARARAMRAARAKAEQLAGLGGAELGDVRRIAEQTGTGGNDPVGMLRMDMAADAAASVPVAGGQLEVTVSVSVVYGLR